MANNANESNVFTVRGLHFAYDHGRVPIFDGLDVTIPEGRITTLIWADLVVPELAQTMVEQASVPILSCS